MVGLQCWTGDNLKLKCAGNVRLCNSGGTLWLRGKMPLVTFYHLLRWEDALMSFHYILMSFQGNDNIVSWRRNIPYRIPIQMIK